MRVQNENRRDPSKSTLGVRGGREEESGFEREREKEGKKTIDSVARRRHVGHRIASQKGRRAEGGSPSALHSESHPGNTHVLPPANRSCFTCSAPWARAHLAPYQPIILENRRTKNDGDKFRDCTWRRVTLLAGHLCNVSGGELLEG